MKRKMDRTTIDCLEQTIPKVEGVSVLLAIMAANPHDIGGLPKMGSAYDLLANNLEEVYEDLTKQLEMELTRQSEEAQQIKGVAIKIVEEGDQNGDEQAELDE